MALDLQTIETIRARKAEYCRLLDTKKFGELEGLFTPEARFVFHGLEGEVLFEFKSRADFLAGASSLFATTRTIHQTHNSEVELISDVEARAVWSMEDWHVYAPEVGQPSKTMHGYGFYHETWRLVDGAWKITRLALTRNILFHGTA